MTTFSDWMVTMGLGEPLTRRAIALGVVEKLINPFRSDSESPSHWRAASIAMGTQTVDPSMLGHVPQERILIRSSSA